eukprot:GFYU01010025.1.p1 GENE.GFYU01010025.1~~GFYU01010025.1.p1  ORF type:complete len:248 (+),score=66.20 GFYU01010025.1:1-744(+)
MVNNFVVLFFGLLFRNEFPNEETKNALGYIVLVVLFMEVAAAAATVVWEILLKAHGVRTDIKSLVFEETDELERSIEIMLTVGGQEFMDMCESFVGERKVPYLLDYIIYEARDTSSNDANTSDDSSSSDEDVSESDVTDKDEGDMSSSDAAASDGSNSDEDTESPMGSETATPITTPTRVRMTRRASGLDTMREIVQGIAEPGKTKTLGAAATRVFEEVYMRMYRKASQSFHQSGLRLGRGSIMKRF